jgi:hypothetical protein
MNHTYLTEEQWEQQFKPLATYDTLPDNVPEHHLWTLMEGLDGGLAYANGIHFVNALTYCECEVPWRDGEEYSVELDTEGLED